MPLTDSFGRRLSTLRLSVTDRCGLRCLYCMPAQGVEWIPDGAILSFDEIERLARVFARLGMRRLRLTGGEPLLRPGLDALVGRLAGIEGIEDLSLTTNGMRLAALAGPLKRAGLRRVTVSLTSLDAGRFKAITRGGDLGAVLAGLSAAESEGLAPLKVNCVILKDNEADLLPLAALTMEHRWEVRFIEVMPMSAALGHAVQPGLSPEILKERLAQRWGPLTEVPTDASAPARRFRLPGALGRLGFISSVSRPFCSTCDRLRIGPTGRLQLCMAHTDGLDLSPLLRGGANDGVLADAIVKAVLRKPEGHAFYRAPVPEGLTMSRIGG